MIRSKHAIKLFLFCQNNAREEKLIFLVSHFFQQKVESAEKLLLETVESVERIVDGGETGIA